MAEYDLAAQIAFRVEPQGKACPECGAGEVWDVVNIATDTAHGRSFRHREDAEDFAEELNEAYRQALAAAVAAERERLRRRIDALLNDRLTGMGPGYDDSITGFNEAWDLVMAFFKRIRSSADG